MSLQIAATSAAVRSYRPSPGAGTHRDTTPPYEERLTAICGLYFFSHYATAL